MERKFEEKLEEIKQSLVSLGSNVAEMVVFMVEGTDIRHSAKIRAVRERLAAESKSGT